MLAQKLQMAETRRRDSGVPWWKKCTSQFCVISQCHCKSNKQSFSCQGVRSFIPFFGLFRFITIENKRKRVHFFSSCLYMNCADRFTSFVMLSFCTECPETCRPRAFFRTEHHTWRLCSWPLYMLFYVHFFAFYRFSGMCQYISQV